MSDIRTLAKRVTTTEVENKVVALDVKINTEVGQEFATESTQLLVLTNTDNLDIALSALRDALRGGSSKSFTDVVTALAPTAKGTQPAAGGLPVQKLNDSGRQQVVYYANGVVPSGTGTAALFTLNKAVDGEALVTGTSFKPGTGKRFRIQEIIFGSTGNATATTADTTFQFKVNTGGVVGTGTGVVVIERRIRTAATAAAFVERRVQYQEGYEILGDGTLQIGVVYTSTFLANAPTIDVMIVGYEY